jgi:hypothetical protein
MDETGDIERQKRIAVELQRSLEETGGKLVETLGLCTNQKKGRIGCPEGGKSGRHNSDSGSGASVS